MAVTLYDVDEILWQRFRLAVLQRGDRVHDVVISAIEEWLVRNPPKNLPSS